MRSGKKAAQKMKYSILTDDWEHCYSCGAYVQHPHEHHIFFGPLRAVSEAHGLKIPLCYRCHNGSKDAVHFNREKDLQYKREAQEAFEKMYGHENWMLTIGRNYL